MKKRQLKKKRALSTLMVIVLLACAITVALKPNAIARAVDAYDISTTVRYANDHWNDGKGACAEFVGDCLAAGGIMLPNKTLYGSNDRVEGNLIGPYGNPYKATDGMLKWCMDSGYNIVRRPSGGAIDWGDINVGDIVFMNNSKGASYGHVVIITGRDAKTGESLYSAHSNARDNARLGNLANYVVQMSKQGDISTPDSTLAISITKGPSGALVLGEKFFFRGSIDSNYAITSATVQVLHRAGGAAQEKTVYPNKTSVDILADGLDSLKFAQLGVDFYTMYLTATDSSGKTAEWSSDFTVGNPVPLSPPVEPSPEPPKEPDMVDSEPPEAEDVVSKLPFSPVMSWSSTQFDDVSSSDWHYQNVKLAYRLNLMKGVRAEAFSPLSKVTVAEAVTLAARIHAAYLGQEKEIPVYDSGDWYDGYVDYAVDNGIPTRGMRMSDNATREQFVYILAAALPKDELAAATEQISFADEDDISHAAAVGLMVKAGVITGVKQNNSLFFNPDSTITRAEAAAVITRMVVPDERVAE